MIKQKGFTLIELLVVIAIIGILATVVAVNFSGATGKAKRVAALQTITDSIKAVSICVASNATPVANPAPGGYVCGDTAATDARYPASSLQGYAIVLPSSVNSSGVFSGNFTASGSGLPAITCTNSSGLINCQ